MKINVSDFKINFGTIAALFIILTLFSCNFDPKEGTDEKVEQQEPEEIIVSLPQAFYSHYTTTIDGEKVSFDLTKDDDNFFGFAHFKNEHQTYKLEGKINDKGVLFLTAVRKSKQLLRIDGRFITETSFKAVLKHTDFDDSDEFTVQEDFSNSLKFGFVTRKDSVFLFDEPDNPSAKIKMTYLEIESQNEAQDSIHKKLNEYFFDKEKGNTTTEIINNYCNKYLVTFKKNEANFDSTRIITDMALYWERDNYLNIIYNENDLLCVESNFYDMSGGAHGNGVSQYYVFDVLSGNKINTNDIFVKNFSGRLGDIITEQIKKDLQTEDLIDAGFFDNLIGPNTNYYINENGIGFYYNAYEIAPYVMGETDVQLQFEQIKDLFKTDTPILKINN